jgi:hypothetical protein
MSEKSSLTRAEATRLRRRQQSQKRIGQVIATNHAAIARHHLA